MSKDEIVERARLLQTVVGRAEQKAMLAEGAEQIEWAKERGATVELYLAAEPQPGQTHICRPGVLSKLLGGRAEVAAIVHLPPLSTSEVVIVLDDVRDPGNVGTIVRTAAGFGFHRFAWIGEPGDLWTRKAVAASRGACFAASLERFETSGDLLAALEGYTVVTTSPHASTPQGCIAPLTGPLAILFGNEKRGVRAELVGRADLLVQIPMSEEMESLNVGVAAGISLYELKTKRLLAMLSTLIQASFGRNLAVTARWMRGVLDKTMQEAVDMSAEQFVDLLMAQCDGEQSEHLAKLWPLYTQVEERLLKGVSIEERAAVLSALEKIRANCAEEIEYDDI